MAGGCHRLQQNVEVFAGIAEGLLTVEQRHIGAWRARLDGAQILKHDLRVLQPFRIGAGSRELLFDLFIRDNAAFFQINEQHFAGLEAPFCDDLFFRHGQNAHLGRHNDQTFVGDIIAGRTQAVAVKRRADLAAIGKSDGCGAVPWLHQSGVIFVERAALLVHQRIAGPGLRDEHHHRMREGIAALHQKFERVVKARGVRLAFIGNRPEL